MSEANKGVFRSFCVPWMPFSIPATMLGMAAAILFYLGNAVFALMFEDVVDADQAMSLFAVELVGFALTFQLPGICSGTLFILQVLLALALWATCGVGICRCISLRLARDEYIGVGDALAFAFGNIRTSALYPVVIAGCLLVLLLVNALLGTLMQIPYIGFIFYVLLPFSFLLGGLQLIIAVTGTWGVGMVSAAVSVESRGTLDAWGKTLNYIFARPIQFILYLVVMKVFILDILVHYMLGEMVLHQWTASALHPLWANETFEAITSGAKGLEGWAAFSASIYSFFSNVVTLFLVGLVLNLTFAAFCSMFLILRRDVDGIDVSDIEMGDLSEAPDPTPVDATQEAAETPDGDAEPGADPQD